MVPLRVWNRRLRRSIEIFRRASLPQKVGSPSSGCLYLHSKLGHFKCYKFMFCSSWKWLSTNSGHVLIEWWCVISFQIHVLFFLKVTFYKQWAYVDWMMMGHFITNSCSVLPESDFLQTVGTCWLNDDVSFHYKFMFCSSWKWLSTNSGNMLIEWWCVMSTRVPQKNKRTLH